MKKGIYFLLLFVTVSLFAQQPRQTTVQGIPHPVLSKKALEGKSRTIAKSSSGDEFDYSSFSFDNIRFWVGEGENRAALIIDWYDDKGEQKAMVWGYKWNGEAYGMDMVRAVAKADKRFMYLTHATNLGNTIAGLGYDLNKSGNNGLVFDNDTQHPHFPVEGMVITDAYNYDSWTSMDPDDHWRSGWMTGYWSYQTMEEGDSDFTYSGLGASSRLLSNGSCDGWVFSDMSGMSGALPRMPFVYAEPETMFANGVFFINEDWFGHNNGSINFLDNNNNWHYRVYQSTNPGKELGVTSQYGTIYGDKLFIVSKQADPTVGSRLAVCQAETMQSLAEFSTIGNADGRSFLGVDTHKGYIGTSSGIYLFDIDNLKIGNRIEGTDSSTGSLYTGQIGTMVRANDRVFAVNQQKGLMVIDTRLDKVATIINAPMDGGKQRGFGSIVQSKDGNLWLSIAKDISGSGNSEDYLLKLNPVTLDTVRVALPKGTGVPNSWYAWTADGFCAGTQENKLYWKNNAGWGNSSKIYEYDIDNNALRTVIDLSTYEPSEVWGIYGAGFRLDPRTNEIYLSLFKSFGDPTYKVVKVNPKDGSVVGSFPMESHYWFPAMPVFPDKYAPVVSGLSDLRVETTTKIYLGDKATDADNMQTAIVKSILSNSNEAILSAVIRNDSLVITPVAGQNGIANLELQFNSNGKTTTKTIAIQLSPATEVENITKGNCNIYPSITTGTVTIVQENLIEELFISNMQGQVLQSLRVHSLESTIDISSYPSGMYLIKIGAQTTRVIKQ